MGTNRSALVGALALAVAACGGRAHSRPAPEAPTLGAPAPAPALRMDAPVPEPFTMVAEPAPPYLQRLVRDLRAGWVLPDLDVHPEPAVACLRLDADGDITDAKIKDSSGEATVDDSIEDALFGLRRLRHDTPEPVPAELVDELTQGWICFRLRAD